MKNLLTMEGIVKIYPNGIIANDGVNFSIEKGEIHALAGENGAGKSTLMKILYGLESPQEGTISLNESVIQLSSPQKAIYYGIGMVHQHFMLVPSLTVSENLVLGMEPGKGLSIDKNKAAEICTVLSRRYNLRVDPHRRIQDLPVGTKQKVEILKALYRGAKILILDEPTAVLTPQETGELFDQLQLLKEEGNTVIFISHKLREVKQFCDRVTIMRNGRHQGVFDTATVSETDISSLMVGRDVILKVEKTRATPKEVRLQVSDISIINDFDKTVVDHLSFNLRRGEILGIAGVEGNGQRELVETLSGLRKFHHGTITIMGHDIKNLSIKEIRGLGTCHIPEDRMTYGVADSLSIEHNLVANKHDSPEFTGKVFTKPDAMRKNSERLIVEYCIKCDSPQQEVKRLSGGNIQKVVVAREFSSEPTVMIADQPTRGIDVGATEFIRKKLVNLRDSGSAVLLISADLNEIMELSDSLIVMYNGRITAYISDASTVNEGELGMYMLGIHQQTPEEVQHAVHE